MKTAFSALLILALFAGPTVCFLAVCTAQPGQHECCPRTQQMAACPFSFLAQSTGAVKVEKTVTFAIAGPASAAVPVMLEQAGNSVPTLAADGRNLHVLNRVLRI